MLGLIFAVASLLPQATRPCHRDGDQTSAYDYHSCTHCNVATGTIVSTILAAAVIRSSSPGHATHIVHLFGFVQSKLRSLVTVMLTRTTTKTTVAKGQPWYYCNFASDAVIF